MILGVVFASFLVLSTSTVVPQVNGSVTTKGFDLIKKLQIATKKLDLIKKLQSAQITSVKSSSTSLFLFPTLFLLLPILIPLILYIILIVIKISKQVFGFLSQLFNALLELYSIIYEQLWEKFRNFLEWIILAIATWIMAVLVLIIEILDELGFW
ncbi:MAG: hypothetical protein DRN18_02685 [Thermoplasmata archaeon]|mgnify:CR=1 FL=1|nr:MAG: hypothetical protein DRN18_02685 [Thermoplasmata archaeon]